jgi:DNA-binding MarR family transcriptional regulator
MTDFIERQGPAFLAHILRRLADDLIQGAKEWYPSVGVTAPPRTISTLLALEEQGPLGVTELAGVLRQSHTLVIVWIRELTRLSLVRSKSDPADGRRTIVVLTSKGRRELLNVHQALITMAQASSELLGADGDAALRALWQMDRALKEKSFPERLREHRRGRDA